MRHHAVVMTATRRPALECPEFAILTAVAFLTRFWKLFLPNAVVWDEVHFERYTAAYFTGRHYIDVHPPLGKLIFYAAARAFGVSGVDLAANQPAPVLRILPAFAGALLIPIVFLILRELCASRRVATVGSACLLLDSALLVISRVIVMDSMLFLFGMSSLYWFLRARQVAGHRRWLLLGTSALAAGMAAATKWTGLTALGLIGLVWIFDIVIERRRGLTVALEALLLIVIPAVAYVAPFAIHFALITQSGVSDSVMPIPYQATLLGNGAHTPGAHYPFWREFVDLHRVMMAVNIGWAADFNVGASKWYTWPVAKHGIGFFGTKADSVRVQWIALFGNPSVWFPLLWGMIAVGAAAAARHGALTRHKFALSLLATGYLANFLPFALIKRPMYLYHYLFAFTFSAMLVALGVGALVGWDGDDERRFWAFPTRRSAALYVGFLSLAAATLIYLAPLTMGSPLSSRELMRRRAVAERRMSALTDSVSTK